MQVMWSGPDVEEDQRPEVDDRQPIGIDRPIGLLRNEVVHHPQESGRQEEADGIVSVPPLGQRVLNPGKGRIALGTEERHRHRHVVDHVQHGDGDDEGQVEPVGHVDMWFLALHDGAQEDHQIGDQTTVSQRSTYHSGSAYSRPWVMPSR